MLSVSIVLLKLSSHSKRKLASRIGPYNDDNYDDDDDSPFQSQRQASR